MRTDHLRKNERGVATLLISMGLLIGLTVLAQTSGRLLFSENQELITVREGKGVKEAARAARAHAKGWLKENELSSLSWSSGGSLDEHASLSSIPAVTVGGRTFDLSITFERRSGSNSEYILVLASAEPQAGTGAQAEVKEYIYYYKGGLNPNFDTPPILIDGSLNGAAGTPDVYPIDHDASTAGIALRTTGTVDTGEGSGLDLHDGSTEENASLSGTLWEAVFGISKAEYKSLATQVDDSSGDVSGDRYYYIEDTSNLNAGHPVVDDSTKEVGTAQEPSILVFSSSAGCPKVNGSVTVYGLAYFEGDQCSGGGQGWGGSTIYGSAIFEGDVSKFTANTEFWDYENLGEGKLKDNLPKRIIGIPGTWRDYSY